MSQIEPIILRVEGKILSKARPQFARGRVIMPEEYVQFKDDAIAQLNPQYSGNTILKCEKIHFYLSGSCLKQDCDNAIGGVLDALVQAGILDDDRIALIPEVYIKYVGKDNPGMTVEIYPESYLGYRKESRLSLEEFKKLKATRKPKRVANMKDRVVKR